MILDNIFILLIILGIFSLILKYIVDIYEKIFNNLLGIQKE